MSWLCFPCIITYLAQLSFTRGYTCTTICTWPYVRTCTISYYCITCCAHHHHMFAKSINIPARANEREWNLRNNYEILNIIIKCELWTVLIAVPSIWHFMIQFIIFRMYCVNSKIHVCVCSQSVMLPTHR